MNVKERSNCLLAPNDAPNNQLLTLVEQLLYPRPLTKVQTIVLQESWNSRGYREIARDHGYDEGFIRNVGSELWRLMTDVLGQKVTKSNVRWMLQDYFQHIKRRE
ncbi:WD-40 repeat protein [Leptolyngbya sp. NIES-3755]|nr:WD-40 repeat protein [Leptolyngbya sp. NIES-3755]